MHTNTYSMQQLIVLTEEQLRQVVAETVKAEFQEGVSLITRSVDTNTDKQDELLTRKQAAKILGVSLPTLHKWTLNKTVKGRTVGTRVRYWRKDVEQALSEIGSAKNNKK